jgi:hypothetical protein
VQRSGEINGYRENEAIEFGTLKVSFGDPHTDQALAKAVRRQSIKIAGAAERAIAVLDPFAFETPIRCSHRIPPSRCQLDRSRSIILFSFGKV